MTLEEGLSSLGPNVVRSKTTNKPRISPERACVCVCVRAWPSVCVSESEGERDKKRLGVVF